MVEGVKYKDTIDEIRLMLERGGAKGLLESLQEWKEMLKDKRFDFVSASFIAQSYIVRKAKVVSLINEMLEQVKKDDIPTAMSMLIDDLLRELKLLEDEWKQLHFRVTREVRDK